MKRLQGVRILFFGVDGLSIDLVQKQIALGTMPNFGALAKKGCLLPLRSSVPPHTALAWPSVFTGVNPGKHGLFQFWNTQSPEYASSITTSGELGSEPLWKTLERYGWSVGVVNVPMTHPPIQPHGGYMLSWPLSKTLRYTEPPELLRELRAAGMHYHSDLMTMYDGTDGYAELASRFMRNRTDTLFFLQASRPVDALIVVYTEIDRISHYFWGDGHEPDSIVLDSYCALDLELGRLVEELESDAIVCVASDHGFGHCNAVWNIHHSLAEAGLLCTRERPSNDGIASWFFGDDGVSVDFERTAVYMPTPGCYGLNLNKKGRQRLGIVDASSETALVRDIQAMLDSMANQEGSWFSLTPREEVYSGPLAERAPDYILTSGPENVMVHPGCGPLTFAQPMQSGIHRMLGTFLIAPLECATNRLRASVEDVTPSICALLGLPLMDSFDGCALFSDLAGLKYEPSVPYRPGGAVSYGQKEKVEIESSLKRLGYL